MARRKMAEATEGSPPEETRDPPQEIPAAPPISPSEAPAEEASQNGEKQQPAFKVGPIATDRNNSVSAAVWANEYTDQKTGRTFTVYNVSVHSSWRDSDGTWKPARSIRGSHVYALIYCLQRTSDWILSQRDPQNDCPF